MNSPQNLDESSDFSQIEEFKEFEFSNKDILELVQNQEKFTLVLNCLVKQAENYFELDNFEVGMKIMVKAEKILEYAANCGKNIDRNLIRLVLHNQAFSYQRLWELTNCSNYLEALIFNLKHTKQGGWNEKSLQQTFHFLNQNMSSSNQFQKIEQISLAKYLLQYSAINSKLKNHKKALQSSAEAIPIIVDLLSYKSKLLLDQNILHQKAISLQRLCDKLKNLKQIVRLNLDQLQKVCRVLYYRWTNNCQKNEKIPENINNFSIKDMMSIKSFRRQLSKLKKQNNMINQENKEDFFNFQILLLCVALFTLSTQIRLWVDYRRQGLRNKDPYHIELDQKEDQSEIYHLLALIIYFAFIPYEICFLTHIFKSFMQKFQILMNSQKQEEILIAESQKQLLQIFTISLNQKSQISTFNILPVNLQNQKQTNNNIGQAINSLKNKVYCCVNEIKSSGKKVNKQNSKTSKDRKFRLSSTSKSKKAKIHSKSKHHEKSKKLGQKKKNKIEKQIEKEYKGNYQNEKGTKKKKNMRVSTTSRNSRSTSRKFIECNKGKLNNYFGL